MQFLAFKIIPIFDICNTSIKNKIQSNPATMKNIIKSKIE